MPDEELPDKKVRIRPRGVDKTESSEEGESAPPSEPTRFDTVLKNRLKPSGKIFDARAETKPRRGRSWEESETENLAKRESDEAEDDSNPAKDEPLRQDSHAPENSPATPLASRKRSGLARTNRRKRNRLLRRVLRPVPVLLIIATTSIAVATLGFFAGHWFGWNDSVALITRERVDVRPEFSGQIDKALATLREGDAIKAQEMLAVVERENPDVASLSYLRALAAMQAGDVPLAEEKVSESLAKGERVSDSLALKAVLATQKGSVPGFQTLGDPQLRSEQFLRQAIVADTANPSPLIELGTLLRYLKRDEEAIALLEAAKTRLNPVDSHTVLNVTLALAKAQKLADSQLDSQPLASQDPTSLFVAAYVAMRKGQFASAAQYLRTCRAQLPIDLFDYLVNDPALRKYAREPLLVPFYQ